MKATSKPEKKNRLARVARGIVYFLLGVAAYYLIDSIYVDVKHAVADAWEETE